MDYMPKVVVAVNPGADSERRFDGLTKNGPSLKQNSHPFVLSSVEGRAGVMPNLETAPKAKDLFRLPLGNLAFQPIYVPFTEVEILGVRVVEDHCRNRRLRVHHVAFGQFHVQVGRHIKQPE